jgi:hypothetical protein
MPPDGVRVLAQCTNQYQAEFIAAQYAKAEESLPDMELTDWLGEVPMVLRVRKTPTSWHIEHWPRDLLLQSEDSVAFP